MRIHQLASVQRFAHFALVALLITALLMQPLGMTEASPDAFTVALTGDLVTLDPALATDGTSGLVATQVYDTLVTYEPGSMLPVPGLAECWTVSVDARTWTLHLRSGVTFHDGTPLNAAAVVFNLQRWWDPAHPYHQGNFAYFRALFGYRGDPNGLIEAISAAGPSAVVIQLTRANNSVLSSLALPAFSIASPAAIQAGTLATAPVGTGPFRFTQWAQGDRVEMQANANHWRGAPRSPFLVFRVIPSAADRLAALRSGAVRSPMTWQPRRAIPNC
jgi:peptide/nickel transport system substrate-binding protein